MIVNHRLESFCADSGQDTTPSPTAQKAGKDKNINRHVTARTEMLMADESEYKVGWLAMLCRCDPGRGQSGDGGKTLASHHRD